MARVALRIVEHRRRRLARLLEGAGYLPIEELCRRLEVSQATCRRDLTALAGREEVRRTFGGAVPMRASPTIGEFDSAFASFRQRRRLAAPSKAALARRALHMVKPGQIIFIDAGTTPFRFAEELVRHPVRRLTVVTHSVMVAIHLASVEGISVHLLGGLILPRQGLTLGLATETAAGGFAFDLAFLGAEAFNHQGVFNSQDDVVRLQRTVISQSRQTRFLLDAAKAGQSAAVRVLDWTHWPAGDVRVLTDAGTQALRENEIPSRFVIRA